MKKWIWLVLLGCTSLQADMLDALKAYEEKNYTAAQQQFAELLPLGNELAAFNLGAMAYHGDGEDKNLEKALAYFMLAAELKHQQAKAVLVDLMVQTTDKQKEQAYHQFENLKQRVVILPVDLDKPVDTSRPKPVKRVEPKYPIQAARNGQFGYVTLRFLVDEKGAVTAIDTLDAYPQNVFETASIKAVKKWQYEPSGKSHVFSVEMNFTLDGGVKVSAVKEAVEKHKLWDYAVLGSPEHQLALGMLFTLISDQSGNGFYYDPELPLSEEIPFSIFERLGKAKADFDGFWGYAVVRVDKDGVIVEQLKAEFEPKSELTNLVGMKLGGNVDTEVYRLSRRSNTRDKSVFVTPSIQVSRAMSGKFWWEQAAKNGNADAQRIMAAYDSQWEQYLLDKQDAEVMAWAGTRMILDGQREEGMALLEQAIAKNYQPAAEMKKQFM